MSERIVTINPGEKITIVIADEKHEYSQKEFLGKTGISRTTLYRKIKSGEISLNSSGKISHETLVNFKNK